MAIRTAAIVQRILNTAEKTSTGVTPAELILSHSIRLSSNTITPVYSSIDFSGTSLSDRMEEWFSWHHTILIAAQEHQLQTDQHKVVENDPDITNCPVNSYVLYNTRPKKMTKPQKSFFNFFFSRFHCQFLFCSRQFLFIIFSYPTGWGSNAPLISTMLI